MTEHDEHGREHRRPPDQRLGPSFDDVLAAARADAPWAYQRLFESLGGPVAGYLRTQGAEDPDGLANEVFLQAFTNLHRFDGDELRFRSWVFTIAHHRLIDDRRRRSRRPRMADDLRDQAGGPSVEPPPTEGADEAALRHLGDERVRTLLAELSADQQDVLLLRIVGDLTVEQVAAAIGKRPGAVKQLQRRGLATLRRRLEGEIDR
jgi:RNA polymerase sigma factor (sigma-70 family)